MSKKTKEVKKEDKRYKLEVGMEVGPEGEKVVMSIVEATGCHRCNDNGCPVCENIKWNIKD